jgi:hypothetical protein
LTLLTRGVVLDLAQPSLGDMQEASYRFSAASGRLEASRREAGDAGAPEYEIVLADVGKSSSDTTTGGSGGGAFDAGRRGRLPHAVEVSIWLTLDEEQAGIAVGGDGGRQTPEARAEEERMADVYGEEFDDVQMGFDLEDVMGGGGPAGSSAHHRDSRTRWRRRPSAAARTRRAMRVAAGRRAAGRGGEGVRPVSRRRGTILLSTLIVVVIAALIGTSMLLIGSAQRASVASSGERAQTRAIAMSGLRRWSANSSASAMNCFEALIPGLPSHGRCSRTAIGRAWCDCCPWDRRGSGSRRRRRGST